jgi:hypothetical protein
VTATYRFDDVQVDVYEDTRTVTTTFADGTYVCAAPNFDPDNIKQAWSLGYQGDTWAMTRDHELTHSLLAVRDGLEHSQTLWRLAHPDADVSHETVALEEAMVLDFQQLLCKTAPRPWDPYREAS